MELGSFMLMSLAAAISTSSIVSLEWVVKLLDLFIFENILINLRSLRIRSLCDLLNISKICVKA